MRCIQRRASVTWYRHQLHSGAALIPERKTWATLITKRRATPMAHRPTDSHAYLKYLAQTGKWVHTKVIRLFCSPCGHVRVLPRTIPDASLTCGEILACHKSTFTRVCLAKSRRFSTVTTTAENMRQLVQPTPHHTAPSYAASRGENPSPYAPANPSEWQPRPLQPARPCAQAKLPLFPLAPHTHDTMAWFRSRDPGEECQPRQ
jgi:hypothetical protein